MDNSPQQQQKLSGSSTSCIVLASSGVNSFKEAPRKYSRHQNHQSFMTSQDKQVQRQIMRKMSRKKHNGNTAAHGNNNNNNNNGGVGQKLSSITSPIRRWTTSFGIKASVNANANAGGSEPILPQKGSSFAELGIYDDTTYSSKDSNIMGIINYRVRRNLTLITLAELVMVSVDCVLCLAFSTFNEDDDPLRLLEKLATIRKLLDFWAFYAIGMWGLYWLYQAAAKRERDKTILFIVWKGLLIVINAAGLLTFISTIIYLETKKQNHYGAYITLAKGKSAILHWEVGVETLLIVSCFKTWICLCVSVAILIYAIKLRRAHCYGNVNHLDSYETTISSGGNEAGGDLCDQYLLNESVTTQDEQQDLQQQQQQQRRRERSPNCLDVPGPNFNNSSKRDTTKKSLMLNLIKAKREGDDREKPMLSTSTTKKKGKKPKRIMSKKMDESGGEPAENVTSDDDTVDDGNASDESTDGSCNHLTVNNKRPEGDR